MRTYNVRLSNGSRAKINLPWGDATRLRRTLQRGVWLKDTDGEYLNPAHIVSFCLNKDGR